MKEAEEFCPKNKKQWRKWLEQNHVDKDAIWLVFYKKSSPKYNLSWSDSVDEALCYGWIDSTKRSIDEERYKQYFTKRKAKSIWSKINKEKIETLIDQGHMTSAGLRSIEIAKENGSWTKHDNVENLEIPKELKQELSKNKEALDYYENLSKSVKKSIIYWIVSAKREETRHKRITEVVESAVRQRKPKVFG